MEINKVYQGDSAVLLKEIPNNFIDLTVTSPPYDNLRDYKGYSFDFETIAKELYRVTKDGGVVVWVVGDATINGTETGTSFRQALFFMNVGFNLYDTMIYHKHSPPLTHRRYEQHFEYMFVLSKGEINTFNPIMEKKNWEDKRKVKSIRREADGSTDLGKPSQSTIKIKGNVWKFNIGGGHVTHDSFAHLHPAIFPEQLAKDHILSWSNEGDLVFDPFAGSGTTLKMAKLINRNYLGFEIAEEYIPLINKRLEQNNIAHFSNTLTSAEVNPAMQESLISVKRDVATSPNSPHDLSTKREEANFS